MEEMPWQALTKKALSLGYRSHKSGTCGLHCHVNRTFFGVTYAKQEENIAKVLFLVEKYWEELLRFSRRTQGQMDHWAARYGFQAKPEQVLDHAKSSGIGIYHLCRMLRVSNPQRTISAGLSGSVCAGGKL